jgi:acyl-CoA thioester hydrolase
MFQSEVQIRVRYAETDQMAYVYYGNYATYFEVARVEAFRNLGMSYKQLEELGIMMPVLEYQTKYYKPAKYDDMLTIKTKVKTMPGVRIVFDYEVYNQENVLLNQAQTTLVFVSKSTLKPTLPPQAFMNLFLPYFA